MILLACDSVEWDRNTYTVSGIYVDTLATVTNCDSIITLNMTINSSYNIIDFITT